jgi:hypothetical protein
VKNTRVIGCPTAFRSLKPTVSLKRLESGAIRKLGFTLRRKTYGSHTLQRYLLRTFDEQYALKVLCAGELEEKRIHYAGRGLLGAEGKAVRDEAVATLVTENWFYGPQDKLLDLYDRSMVVPESVKDFQAELLQLDAVTGFRLHGNLLALANGIPALYVTYDTRTSEFVKTLGIPAVGVKQMDRFNFRETWDNAKWDGFESTYARRFRELTTYLEENGLAHRLAAPVTPAKPAKTAVAA